MKVKQLLELMKDMTTFGNREKKNHEAYIGEYTFNNRNGDLLNLSEELEKEIINIININLLRKTIKLELFDSTMNSNDKVSLKDLLDVLSHTEFLCTWLCDVKFCGRDIPIEITVRRSTGNEKVFWKGTDMNVYGRCKPFAWDKLQNLIVEEITEINFEKEYVLRIIVNGEEN